jgi:hypothetical protein
MPVLSERSSFRPRRDEESTLIRSLTRNDDGMDDEIRSGPRDPVRSAGWTHSLEELGEVCVGIDPSLRPVVNGAVPMSEYAWRFRYPGEPDDPEPEEVAEAMGLARGVFRAVLDRLPPEVTPGS